MTTDEKLKPDIASRADIQTLVDQFYTIVKNDPQIGEFFTSVARVDWDRHLPQMYDFWESILFSKNVFSGNPMKKHKELHQKKAMQIEHFERWLEIFNLTVDKLFSGKNAASIKEKAMIIKENLATRVLASKNIFAIM